MELRKGHSCLRRQIVRAEGGVGTKKISWRGGWVVVVVVVVEEEGLR